MVTKLSKIWVCDPGSRIRDSGSELQDPGFEIQDPGTGKNLFQFPDLRSGSAALAKTDPLVNKHRQDAD